MPSELALYSDRFFMAALAVYVLAMVLHAVELAAVRSAAPHDVIAAKPQLGRGETPTRGGVLVGEGGSDPAGRTRPRSERLGRMAVALTVLGVVLHAGSVVTRGIAAQRWPLGNMYEYLSAICLFAVLTWLVVLRRSPGSRPAGPFVLVPVAILMIVALRGVYSEVGPVQPALQSYWLVIHVSTISLSSGLLLVPGVASILFLLKRSGRFSGFTDVLPSADALDRVAYRVTTVAFPLFTFAVITGAIWAESAWGRFWGWDPKETVSFVSWVIYAAYLHARATAGWRAERAAWINVGGFATMVFNLFFINLVVAGLHSYAGG